MRQRQNKRKDTVGPAFGTAQLWRMMIVILALITIAVVALTTLKYVNTRRHISIAVIRQLTVQAENRLTGFVQPVVTNIAIIKRWATSGDLEISDPAALTPRLIPILEQVPQIYSVQIGSDVGPVYAVLRDNGGWRAFFGQTREGRSVSGTWRQLTSSGTTVKEWQARKQLPAAANSQFQRIAGLQADEIYWTEPEELFPDGRIGLAAVTAIDLDSRKAVIAVPVLMKDLRAVINSVRIGDSFRLFIYSESEVLVDFQRMDRRRLMQAASADAARGAGGAQTSLVASALRHWQTSGSPEDPYVFVHQGQRWWGLLQNFDAGDGNGGIGILVTENDLIDQQKPEKYLFVPLAFAFIWAAFLVFVRLHRKASDDAATPLQANRFTEAALQKLINAGEQEKVEFKSTLRWNLKADRAGKEIELAVLKTVAAFMNSDGGMLMIGVGDKGEILGIEADRFDSEDGFLRHFSSLFNQHIGLEFSESVAFALHSIRGRRICVVRCSKSSQPVFVRHKKEESFYVRSGPSSRQLSVSQVIEYLKDRQVSERRRS